MEQKNKIIDIIVIPIILGLTVNFIYDIVKNHSYANKSGLKIEFNLKIKLY